MKKLGKRVARLPRAGGFTLIELLVTIGVSAIVLSLAVPSFTTILANNRVTAGVNDLIASMQLARSEAVKRASAVTICRVADVAAPECATGAGWQDGWVVFIDVDGDAAIDNEDTVLRREDGMGGSIVVYVPNGAAPLGDALTYLESGFPATAGGGGGRNMLLCDDRENNATSRVLNISQTGRPQVRQYADVSNPGATCES